MPVDIVAADQNSVVLARQVNPSILTPQWLMQQHLIAADAIRDGTLIASQLVQIRTDDFELLVIPDRLQLAPTCAPERQGELVRHILGGIVNSLPHTPYVAVGFNFNYHVFYREEDFAARIRWLFHDNPVSASFNVPDARFGAYYSKDFSVFRLNLDIKPIIVPEQGEAILFHFNFNRDINAAGIIQDTLGHWDEARHMATTLMDAVRR